MRKMSLFPALLLLSLLLAGCGSSTEVISDTAIPEEGVIVASYENNVLTSGRGWFGDLPKGLRPMLLVNGKLYRWTGMSKELHILDSGEVYTTGDSSTFLPEGYAAVGQISGVTEAVPSEEFQLRAAFEADGTVYTNPDTPEVVYALMTTSWFEDYYIRFVSDDLRDNERISYQGRQYLFSANYEICESITELPEECTLVGTLTYISTDRIPVNDLETNRISDSFSKFLGGREVFADPEDPGALYVYEHYYRAQGDYPAWRVCRLLSE